MSQKRLWQLPALLIKEEGQLLVSLIGRNAWQKNIRKGRFVLAHRLRELSPAVMWPQALEQGIMEWEHVTEQLLYLISTGSWARNRKGKGKNTARPHAPNDLLPPSWPYLLKFPWPPRTAPPSGTEHLNMNFCGTLNTSTVITGHACLTQMVPSVFGATLQAPHTDDPAS